MNHDHLISREQVLRAQIANGEHVTRDITDAKLYELRSKLIRVLSQLEEPDATDVPTTHCPKHPKGPVDASAQDLCLLCERRRRELAPKPTPFDEVSPLATAETENDPIQDSPLNPVLSLAQASPMPSSEFPFPWDRFDQPEPDPRAGDTATRPSRHDRSFDGYGTSARGSAPGLGVSGQGRIR